MNTTLSLEDPLAGKEVHIHVILPASELASDIRPVMVSLGLPGTVPVFHNGQMGNLMTLLAEAWTMCGVRAKTAPTASSQETETVIETAVTAESEDDDSAETIAEISVPPVPSPVKPKQTTPKPKAQLSLF